MIIERVLVPNRTPILQLYGLTSGSAVGSPITGTAISGRPARYEFNVGSPAAGYYTVDVYVTDATKPIAAFNIHILADGSYRVLEEIWQDPDLDSGVVSGDNAVTITALNGVTPIVGARVTVHQNGDVLAYGLTNSSGQVVVLLDAGTYAVNVSATGFVQAVNQTLVVDGVESLSVAMRSASLPTAVSLNTWDGRALAYGSTEALQQLLSTSKRVMLLGDSTSTRGALDYQRPFYKSSRIKSLYLDVGPVPYGGAGKTRGESSTLGGTMNYSPTFYAMEFAFPSSFTSGNLWYDNRVATYSLFGPARPDSAHIAEQDNASTWSGSWVQLSKTQGVQVTFEYLAGPHGDPQSNLFLQLRVGTSTILATSANFSSYSATLEIKQVTLSVASWTGTGDSLNVEVRGVSNNVPTAGGKKFVAIGCGFDLVTGGSTHQRITAVGFGGETVANYIQSSWMSDTGWAAVRARFDGAIIALGINGFAIPSLAQWKADYQTLINKLRNGSTTMPIVMITESRLASPQSGFFDALKDLVDANPNTIAIDTQAQMPDYSVLFQGWTGEWQSGAYYSLGDTVLRTSQGRTYTHKVLYPGAVSTTAPESDTTNWNANGTGLDNWVTTVTNTNNYVYGDAIHPTAQGHRIQGAAFWSCLDAVAAYSSNTSASEGGASGPGVGLCDVTFAVSHNGNVVPGARVSAKLIAKNNTLDKFLESKAITEGETNSQGICVLTLVQFAFFTRGGTYQIKVTDPLGQVLHDRIVNIPTLSAVNAEDIPDL